MPRKRTCSVSGSAGRHKTDAGDQPPVAADRAEALRLVPVSRETVERLDAYVDLLLAWQSRLNLIAPSTVPRLWTRHIADSLQLLRHAPEAAIWLDLGSGAGFPGLPLACALAGRAGACVHLVEADGRKAAFLREAIRILKVPAHIHAERVEALGQHWEGRVDVITARALAPLARLLGYAAPWLESGAQALFLKGQDVDAELTEAAKSWHMETKLLASITDSRGRIVHVRSAHRIRR